MPDHKSIASLPACWMLVGMAVLSFIPTLFVPYTGEEGVYTITSMEMARNRDWLTPTLFGEPYPRPPLINWLMIPLANLFGWENVLIASRLITALATVGTGLLLIAWVQRMYGDPHLAVFSGLFFFSGDILFNRGWIAYADPLFGFFIFLAVSSLLLAVHENRAGFLAGVLIGLAGSFMSKAVTGYLFYGIALMVVLCTEKKSRRVLSSSASILIHLLALAYPFFWWALNDDGATISNMLGVLTDKATGASRPVSPGAYFAGRFEFLGGTVLALLPGSVLAGYLVFRARGLSSLREVPLARAVLWLVIGNYVPYLLAPDTNIRYILPLYPWFALLTAILLVRSRQGLNFHRGLYNLFGVMIVLKFVAGAGLFSWFEVNYRTGDFNEAARTVLTETEGYPLYVVDLSHLGLTLAAHINILRWPEGPLLGRPDHGWKNGFVLAREYHFPKDRTLHTFKFARGTLYLRCRGAACSRQDR